MSAKQTILMDDEMTSNHEATDEVHPSACPPAPNMSEQPYIHTPLHETSFFY